MKKWIINFLVLFLCFFATQSKGEEGNFVINNLADPGSYTLSDGQLILFGTMRAHAKIHVPLFKGKNLNELMSAKVQDAMPILPKWTSERPIMAPDLVEINEKYYLYYVAKHKLRGIYCIGVAESKKTEGPYASINNEPLVCPENIQGEKKGVIGPNVFVDIDGSRYLTYKLNGNKQKKGSPSRLMFIDKILDNGTAVANHPIALLRADQEWEKGNVEAPELVFNKGTYYLFYSGSGFHKLSYAVGYATSKNLYGPYVKSSNNPIIFSDNKYYGPGSQSITPDKCGNLLFFFNAYDNPKLEKFRKTYVKKLVFENDKPKFLDVDPNVTCH